jgi:hypothetical protein
MRATSNARKNLVKLSHQQVIQVLIYYYYYYYYQGCPDYFTPGGGGLTENFQNSRGVGLNFPFEIFPDEIFQEGG